MSRTSRVKRGITAVASLGIALLAGTATTAQADPLGGLIINHGTGRCLSIGGQYGPQAVSCDEQDGSQKWRVDRRDDGTVRIVAAWADPYRPCLASYIYGGVSMGSCDDGTNGPIWFIRDGGKLEQFGSEKWCLTVKDGNLGTAPCDSGYNRYQDWILPVS
ncbi:ricin-type beta-trefoil lectin domain protein [Streptomyces sp. NPDC057543]|uniref:ricin-type beta-trefoil lectin domain protein n=1 Tax=Streptomyces sp. NPDC057543 TaxID=3346163 RepID=UPI00367E12C6